MDKVILSGLLGAAAGAIGWALARKIHGNEKVEQLYPLYSLCLFVLFQAFVMFSRPTQ
jgi:hypothetical protein